MMQIIPVTIATVLVGLGSTSVQALTPYSITLRSSAIGVIILGTLASHRRRGPSESLRTLTGLAVLNALWLCAAAVPASQFAPLLTRLSTVAGFLVLAYCLARHYDAKRVLTGLKWGLALLVTGSLAALSQPAISIESGRTRGLFENANLFGFACFLLAFIVLVTPRGRSASSLLLIVSCVGLAASGSRGSALALAIALAGLIWYVRDIRAQLVGALAGIGVIVAFAAWPQWFASQYLFRTNNSRSGSLEAATLALERSPVWGLGLGEDGVISADYAVAGSPFAAAIQSGYVGLAVIGVTYLYLLQSSRRAGRVTTIFALAILVHSVFEGWLLSLSSPMTLLACILWIGLDRGTRSPNDAAPPTGQSSGAANHRTRHRTARVRPLARRHLLGSGILGPDT